MQKTINAAFGIGLVLVAIAIATLYLNPPAATQPDWEALVESAVSERLAAIEVTPSPDQVPMANDELGTAIETYLMGNPRILERLSQALDSELRAEETEVTRAALADFHDVIYNDPANVVLGNPNGDVTLVEMFDYNCGYCRQVVPDLLALIDEDPDLRIILKEFPILSQGSMDAARVGVLVNRAGADYADFHIQLFSSRGAIDADAALTAAEAVGLSRLPLELDMNNSDVTETIQRSYTIAQALGVSGTPTFIIGDEVIPGAISREELSRRIANMRECGQTVCS